MASTIVVDKIQKTGGEALEWPAADGDAGQLIKTNGSGVLSFVADTDTGITDLVDDTSPQLGNPLDCNGKQIQWSQGADVVSATALAVLTDGNYFDVTGTVTIVTINTTGGVGTQIKLHFDGALTLTNSADIVLPTGANILTAAGDEAEFIEYASGDYRCTSYTRASGAALKIADESIDSDHYVDGSIDNAHIVEMAGNKLTGTVTAKGDGASAVGKLLVNCENNSHGITIQSPVHSSAAAYTLTLPVDDGDADEVLKTNGSGVLDWVANSTTAGVATIWVPSNAMTPTDDAGCEGITTVATQAGRPDMNVLDFLVASDSFAQFQIAFPKSWNEGTITYQVYWCSTAADTDNVNWTLQGVSVPDNSTIDVAYGAAIDVDDPNQGAAEEMLVSPVSGALTIASAAVDTVTFFRIGRDVSEGTAAEAARLLGVKLFFTTDAENDD
tara:strand:+ start:792 stop:2120 length:1329 start_codon:yes stop_codon:yes gene_type:complete